MRARAGEPGDFIAFARGHDLDEAPVLYANLLEELEAAGRSEGVDKLDLELKSICCSGEGEGWSENDSRDLDWAGDLDCPGARRVRRMIGELESFSARSWRLFQFIEARSHLWESEEVQPCSGLDRAVLMREMLEDAVRAGNLAWVPLHALTQPLKTMSGPASAKYRNELQRAFSTTLEDLVNGYRPSRELDHHESWLSFEALAEARDSGLLGREGRLATQVCSSRFGLSTPPRDDELVDFADLCAGLLSPAPLARELRRLAEEAERIPLDRESWQVLAELAARMARLGKLREARLIADKSFSSSGRLDAYTRLLLEYSAGQSPEGAFSSSCRESSDE